MVNITPILEHALGIGEINSKEELLALADALEELGDDPRFNSKNMAELMEIIKAKKAENKNLML